jgi:hypothetical protein
MKSRETSIEGTAAVPPDVHAKFASAECIQVTRAIDGEVETVRRHFLQRRIRPDARRVGLCCHGLHAEADHIPGARCGRLASSGWRCVLRSSRTNDQENQFGSYRQSHALYLVWGGLLHSGCACAPHSPPELSNVR